MSLHGQKRERRMTRREEQYRSEQMRQLVDAEHEQRMNWIRLFLWAIVFIVVCSFMGFLLFIGF